MADASSQQIFSVGSVFVPVRDQDAALAYYRDTLGFELRGDVPFGDGDRWIEVAPPGAQTAVALTAPMEGSPPPGGDAAFSYDTEDLDATIAALSARGVEFEEVMRMPDPVPPMAFFRDLDGNRMLLVQR